MTEGGHQWVISNRKEKDLWEEEKLGKVKGIGKVRQEQLATMQNISVKQLKYATINRLTEIAHETKIGVKMLQEKVQYANEGSIPENLIKDHQQADNPYLSCYGTYWGDENIKAAKVHPYTCITNVIEHMIKECEMVFQGTKHANDWFFTMMH